MLSTLLSPARRRDVYVCGALVAAAAMAACDKSEPTSPLHADAPNATRNGFVVPSTIALTTLDEKNAAVGYYGAEFEIWGPFGLHKIEDDNGPDDSDNTLGHIKLVGLVNGQYKICEINVPMGFLIAGQQCVTGYLNPGAEMAETFFNPRPPYLQWNATNDVGTSVGGGASFTVKDSLGMGFTVTDGQWSDSNPWDGQLQTSVAHPGTWTICETTAPSGYVKPVGQACKNIVVAWGAIGWAGGFANNYPYSVNWGVTEGVLDVNNNYVPLAGATFTVAYQRGLSKTTVVDNGAGDYDPRPGRIAMKLGAAGSYTVCETQAPANHWLPKTPCQTVSVAYDAPAFAGWFITPQSQVIYIP